MNAVPGATLRPLTLALMLALTLPAAGWSVRVQAQAAVQTYAIAAGPLDATLTSIARQSGRVVAFSPDLVAGLRAQPVNGNLDAESAVRQALAGTPLQLLVAGDGTLTVRREGDAGVRQLSSVRVVGRTGDEKKQDNVYQENVTSVYVDREQLQRFQTTNPGDVFKGMNGVYSMDTRSSQSITPNIRGVTGEGRTPLTIDGTEQSTNVWLHMFGAGNRNYADPALFRSVEVEKGPSLSRHLKSGVGGAVNIRTIEAGDIIPEGDSWGIEVKLESAGNTSKPQVDPNSFFGQDYRNIPGAERVGMTSPENPARTTVVVPSPPLRTKGKSEIFNFEDHSQMVAIAARNDVADILFSYSQRSKGNYYSGKNGADDYRGHPALARNTVDRYIPNLTKLYAPGGEVFNTSGETKTTLIKNTWYLPNDQKIGLRFMRTDLNFGETTPGDTVLMWSLREGAEESHPDADWSSMQFVFEKPRSELRLDSYSLDYELKPEGSKWLNLESRLWRTKTSGTRYQTGASPYGVYMDKDTAIAMSFYDMIVDMGLGDFYDPPEHDGTILPEGRQWTSHDRTGFDLSNQMQLSDRLQFTVGGSYQQEKLDDRVQTYRGGNAGGIFLDGAMLQASSERLGPRSGKRKEYSATMNLNWQATDWLTVTAGARYLRYTAKDTGLAERRRQQDAFYTAQRRKAGLQLQYEELMTPEDKAELSRLQAEATAAFDAMDYNDPSNFKDWTLAVTGTNGVTTITTRRYATEDAAFRAASQNLLSFLSEHNANPFVSNAQNSQTQLPEETDASEIAFFHMFSGGGFRHGGTPNVPDSYYARGNYWAKSVLLPSKDGKYDASLNPFATGEADATEMVDDPYNPGATVARYRPSNNNVMGTEVYEHLDAGNAWEMPSDQSGHAFSPVLSATARITPYSTAFIRYAQTTRFPSIYELTSSAIVDGAGTEGALTINGASKPERSINWEVGYAHDLTQFLPDLNLADVRISYYNTEIRNYIDRTRALDTIQFDRKKSSGLELQSRFDTGRIFGSLGATYRLTQKLCDKDYASGMDPFFNRIPECMTGGFPGTYSGSSLQPKYSIDMALGARWLNGRLELGWRGVYHAGAKNKQLDRLLASEAGSSVTTQLPRDMWDRGDTSFYTFYWQPVFLHDIYARFDINKQVSMNLSVNNLTDHYYLDPMSKTLLPGPGRTITLGLTARF